MKQKQREDGLIFENREEKNNFVVHILKFNETKKVFSFECQN